MVMVATWIVLSIAVFSILLLSYGYLADVSKALRDDWKRTFPDPTQLPSPPLSEKAKAQADKWLADNPVNGDPWKAVPLPTQESK